MSRLKELSLFTGVGGGLLASVLLDHKIIGAVEMDSYCCRVLEQRQEDGIFERFPIFNTDIRDFIRNGYAKLYQGRCDIVSAGFPCQPFSVAGKRKGADDPKNMWPATLEAIRIIRPRYCFLENVRGILSSGYFQEILKDLAESGYDARWRVLSAAELGAPHKRERLWVVADTSSEGLEGSAGEGIQGEGIRSAWDSRETTDTGGKRLEGQRQKSGGVETKFHNSTHRSWWEIEPDVGRVAHGVASRVDRIKALGNGQVSVVAAKAWQLLTEDIL